MNKQDLDKAVLDTAKWARSFMRKNHGDFEQHVLLFPVDKNEAPRIVVMAGFVLHGAHMAGAIRKVAAEVKGGVEAVIIATDTRLKMMSSMDEVKDIEDKIGQGAYSIAGDTANPECLVVVGSSRGHTSSCFNVYKRYPLSGGDRIKFEKKPEIETTLEGLHLYFMPNLWGN